MYGGLAYLCLWYVWGTSILPVFLWSRNGATHFGSENNRSDLRAINFDTLSWNASSLESKYKYGYRYWSKLVNNKTGKFIKKILYNFNMWYVLDLVAYAN